MSERWKRSLSKVEWWKAGKYERGFVAHPAYSQRDPDPSKDYGIHGVEMCWYVRGKKGVTQFLLFTNWQLPEVTKEQEADPSTYISASRGGHLFCRPMPADLGYHSVKPRYKEQYRMECNTLPQGFCYYDGSGLNAERVFERLLREGSDGVWAELEDYYRAVFR